MPFRIRFENLDVNIENDDKEFLLSVIKAIKEDDFIFQELEWVTKVDKADDSPKYSLESLHQAL